MAALQAKPDDRWNFTIEATILEEDAEYLRRNPPQIKRHKREKTVVCKHWMNGLCKKGEDCGYLHQYDMSKMPECQFFRDYGMCTNEATHAHAAWVVSMRESRTLFPGASATAVSILGHADAPSSQLAAPAYTVGPQARSAAVQSHHGL